MIRFFYILAFLKLIPACLLAQYASTSLYTAEDGLPYTEIHSVNIMPDGSLLIGQGCNGVFRFDGENWIETGKGLCAQYLYPEENGVLWASYYFNQKIITKDSVLDLHFSENALFKDTLYSGDHIGYSTVLRGQNGRHAISINFGNLACLYLLDTVTNSLVLKDSARVSDAGKRKHYTTTALTPVTYIQSINQPTDFWWYRKKAGAVERLGKFRFKQGEQFFQTTHSPFHFFIKKGNKILKWEEKTSSFQSFLELPSPSYSSTHLYFGYSPHDQHYFFYISNGKEHIIYDFEPDFKKYTRTAFLFQGEIRQLAKGQFGTYWAATHRGLLRVFPYFTNFFVEDNPKMLPNVHALAKAKNGKIWFGSYGNGFGFILNDTIFSGPANFNPNLKVLPGAALDKEGRPLFIVEDHFDYKGLVRIDQEDRLITNNLKEFGYFLGYDQEQQLMFGSSQKGLFLKKSLCRDSADCWTNIGVEKGFGLTNVISAFQDKLGRYWMFRPSKGIAVYLPEKDTVLNFFREKKETDLAVWSSLIDVNGNIWLGTSSGLKRFEPPSKISKTFKPDAYTFDVNSGSMAPVIIMSLAYVKDLYLAFSTSEGMGLLDLKSFQNDPKNPIVYSFSHENGYSGSSGEQNAAWVDEVNNVWLVNDRGISRFNISLFCPDARKPVIEILNVSSYGETFNELSHQPLRLSQRHTNIKFNYKVKSNLAPNEPITYFYQFGRGSLSKTNESEVQFSNLQYGSYTFTLYAVRNGIWSDPAVVHFRIPRPFVERPAFYILLSLIFSGLLGGAYYLKQQQNKRRNQLLSLRVQTIVNQLNPHFVNNTLGWLQARAQKHRDLEAVALLDKLAQNIKVIFKNSRERRSHHLLKDELKLVRNYFSIQKARFGDHFVYDLPKEDLIAEWGHKVSVPLMLLQIHCENAVEHGIRNRKNGGYVKIDILDEGVDLIFKIEDNGIGRKKAEKIGSIGTQQGIQMIKELIQLYNKGNYRHIRQYYEDDWTIDENGTPHGTRVFIRVPKHYRYEFTNELHTPRR